MKNRLTTTLLLCFFYVVCCAQLSISNKELSQLDKELSLIPSYDKLKYNTIDSLKRVMSKTKPFSAEKAKALIFIAHEYETFISDSAFVYYNQAEQVARQSSDSVIAIHARLGKVKVLGILGFFKEGIAELEDIEKSPIPSSLKGDWLDSARQLYSYMVAYTQQNGPYYEEYNALLNKYRDEQLKLLDKNSYLYREFLAEHYYAYDQTQKAKVLLTEILEDVPVTSNIYARAAANMAIIKEKEGVETAAAYYLALSAISDIKGSVKENTALQKLAVYLYTKGDITHAYSYISASLADAVFCNARLRTTEVSKIMPLIDGAYKVQLDKKQQMLLITTLIVSVLSICLIIAVLLARQQMRRLRLARQHLKEANSIKDEYIGHFLDLCSIYMDRLDNFCKVVTRKITAGQIEELVQMTKSSKFAEDQHKQFYENFDGAFLHIYPTFIEEFNTLLIPSERINIKDPGKLTTELRIFAFLRMGVEDSNKIASFLHYSVNTIYTYRNKIKNKALDREHFESNVMKIGSIS